VVVAGVCLGPDQISHVPAVMKEVQVSYAVYYRTDEFASAARLLNSGTLDPASFVSRTVPLDAVAQAFEDLQSGSSDRKVLIDPSV
jgi:threonine dehydrogenase-like Zn-dependent dehydrogenase